MNFNTEMQLLIDKEAAYIEGLQCYPTVLGMLLCHEYTYQEIRDYVISQGGLISKSALARYYSRRLIKEKR